MIFHGSGMRWTAHSALSSQIPPENMQDSGPYYNGTNINQNADPVPQHLRDPAKNDLRHGIVRIDIEHINFSKRMKQQIKQSCR